MTTSYVFKRCKAFGFATTMDDALKDIDNTDNVLYIGTTDSKLFPKHTLAEALTVVPKADTMVLVELATVERVLVKKHRVNTTELQDIGKYLTANIPDGYTLGEVAEAMDTLEKLYINKYHLKGKTMHDKFYSLVKDIYDDITDTEFKETLQGILPNTGDLGSIVYDEEEVDKVLPTADFSDIEITCEDKAVGTSSSLCKTSDAETIGSATQLEAFSKGMFTVIRGRKSACIEATSRLQNHDILDLLARNGVICTPEAVRNTSLDKLMRMLSKYQSFEVIFIHPSLIKSIKMDSPHEHSLPEYTMNEGELLAIVFRYLCLSFFGYKGIYSDVYREYEYLF